MIIQYTQRWLYQASRLTAFLQRSTQMVTGIFQDSRFLYHAGGKLRRLGLAHFQKTYVLEQRAARQGACRQCGTCCNLLFTCPRLTKRSHCLAYGTCRPQVCRIFPIDQRDIQEVALYGARCGFYFSTAAPPVRAWWDFRRSCHTSRARQGDDTDFPDV